nr:MAG TPA: hypothetical protein [Caudoviricetes sp.]
MHNYAIKYFQNKITRLKTDRFDKYSNNINKSRRCLYGKK